MESSLPTFAVAGIYSPKGIDLGICQHLALSVSGTAPGKLFAGGERWDYSAVSGIRNSQLYPTP